MSQSIQLAAHCIKLAISSDVGDIYVMMTQWCYSYC